MTLAPTLPRPVAIAVAAGAAFFAVLAQRLPGGASAIEVSSAALRVALLAAWLVLLTWNAVECAHAWRAQRTLPAWRLTLLGSALVILRMREAPLAAPVALLWLALLLFAGQWAACRALGRERAPRGYWIGAAVAVAPWALLPGVPRWP